MIYRASLVANIVKNLPTMQQESWVQFLGREDPLEKGMETHSSILAHSKHFCYEKKAASRSGKAI